MISDLDIRGNTCNAIRITPMSSVVTELRSKNEIPDKFTGSITIHCHEGNIASKVEVKRTVKIK